MSERSGNDHVALRFPRLAARDLEGRARSLPHASQKLVAARSPRIRTFGVSPMRSRSTTPARCGTAHVTMTPDRLVARFGPWTCETSVGNVREVCRTGPYRWFKAIGPRGSFVDRGLTFGTTTKAGVCVLWREPVSGLTPLDSLRHPAITLTLAEPERFVASLHRRAGLA